MLQHVTASSQNPAFVVLVGLLGSGGLDIGVLDSQAPDVEVVADANNHVCDKRAVNADAEAEAHEDEGDLVGVAAEGGWPADANVRLQDGAETIDYAEEERYDEDVGHGEAGLGQMCGNHLADRVGVDEGNVEDKGDEVVVKNDGVEFEVGGNEDPSCEEREEAIKGGDGVLVSCATGGHHVEGTMQSSV